jgi:hypothetical protein
VDHSTNFRNVDPHRNSKSISDRPYVGYVLQSIVDPPEASHDEHKEEEISTNNPPSDYPEIVPKDTLNNADAVSSPLKRVHLSVDFGDFEILPLEELSCPICLVNYEHGEIVQRNACSGYCNNHTHRNHNMASLTIDMNQCDHIFHKKCIAQWIQSNLRNECPICRRVFRDGDALTNSIA